MRGCDHGGEDFQRGSEPWFGYRVADSGGGEQYAADAGQPVDRILESARQATGEPADSGPPQAWAAWGWSHLQSALAAARGAGADAADAHLAEAASAAGHLPAGADHYRMTVNRTNVAIWSVGLAVELGDGQEAVRRASTMRGFAGVTPNRISHHYIDLARAHL